MGLKTGFKFKKFDIENVEDAVFGVNYDDSGWREVRVPHDWGIEGDFSADNDPSESSIIEDGINKPITLTGRTGGLPILGAGVYRKWVRVEKSDRAFLEFDGVMWYSRIYVNGRLAGSNHFGYKSFSVDITEYVNFGEDNLIAVYAEVKADCGRWYSGGGIFRNVRLVNKPEKHFLYNGIWARQVYADKKLAIIDISAETVNTAGFKAEGGAYVFATDAGDQRETETFLRPDKKAMSGMLVAVMRSTGEKGRVTVTACAEGLKEGTVSFECK